MNGIPKVYLSTEVGEQLKTMPHKEIEPDRWAAVRPVPYPGVRLFTRLKLAWLVFSGEADVLRWKA